jgi:predicted lipoprotein with Yx(FWY)xxD motif
VQLVRTRFIFLCLLAAIVVAGCGSSNSSSTSTAAAAPSTSSSTAASTSSSASSSAAAAMPVVLSTKHDKKLGTVLAAGSKKMTVYLFEADKGGKSSCNGACAGAWPPLIGTAAASGGASASDIGTTMRSDGATQVTYKGHPLYYYIKDKDDGDAYGQNKHEFGADWYVLAPSGKKIDPS